MTLPTISCTPCVSFAAYLISRYEKNVDLDIITPSALGHDLKVYPKDHPDRYASQRDSAEIMGTILYAVDIFPKYKIPSVQTCILECSFSNETVPKMLESRILQDADKLESTGAISIMRTFASTGQMMRPFYNPDDPFCENRDPNSMMYALDLVYQRLLKVPERMHTEKGRELAEKGNYFLIQFLDEVQLELKRK